MSLISYYYLTGHILGKDKTSNREVLAILEATQIFLASFQGKVVVESEFWQILLGISAPQKALASILL